VAETSPQVVLGNDGLSLSGPRYAASHPGTLSEGADAVLGRGGLYGEAPASTEKYRDVLKDLERHQIKNMRLCSDSAGTRTTQLSMAPPLHGGEAGVQSPSAPHHKFAHLQVELKT
jgi:hypothetical protein